MNETITITGNVATEPQYKHPEGGVSITTFRVASGQRRFDRQSGAWVDGATNWYTVSTYRSLADHAFRSLHKGDRVLLTGRLKVREWENGEKRGTAVEIDADAIGHDLLWGNSTFEKDARPAAVPTRPADAWSTPGVEGETTTEWEVAAVPTGEGEGEPRQRELAGADAPF